MKLFLKRNFVFAFSFFVLFFGCSKEIEQTVSKNFTLDGIESGVAPIYNAPANGRPIKDAYIVVFKDDVSDVDQLVEALSKQGGFKPKFSYKYAIKGFAATIPAQALEGISRNPYVKYIDQDQEVKLEGTQTGVTWGIDRIDQSSIPLSNSYTYNTTGSAVDAYIFDTGIKHDHLEFEGRAVNLYDAITIGGSGIDGNGHGTHVAGTVGGKTYGVAKSINLYGVKVLADNGSGSYSGILAGIDKAINHHTTRPAVGNMSLGGGYYSTLNTAVKNAIADGIVMCVAAGNSAADAANYSPASTAEAITVGATDRNDVFASYSNYGSLVDILAPGTSITSAWFSSTTAINTISGTSMATPHVAGAAALYLEANPGSTPAQVQTGLKNSAVIGKISSVRSGTVNALLNINFSNSTVISTLPSKPVLINPVNSSKDQPTSLNFSWQTSTDAQSYNLQISTSSSFSTLALNSNTTTTTVSVSGFAAGTFYYWRVIANNNAGTAISDSWSFSTLLNTPVLSSPSNGATGVSTTPTLKWNGVTNATGYDIQVSRDNTFPATTATLTFSTSSTSIKLGTQLLSTTQYFWRVRAKRSSVLSSWSSSRSFTTF